MGQPSEVAGRLAELAIRPVAQAAARANAPSAAGGVAALPAAESSATNTCRNNARLRAATLGRKVVPALPSWAHDEVGLTLRVLSDRLDESKIEQLRAWGTGLAANGSADLRATGKAILMLIEEIERLHIDLWNARSPLEESAAEARKDVFDIADEALLERTLRDRLSRLRSRK